MAGQSKKSRKFRENRKNFQKGLEITRRKVYNQCTRMCKALQRKEKRSMKEQYKTPEIEIVVFENEDIVTSSTPEIDF